MTKQSGMKQVSAILVACFALLVQPSLAFAPTRMLFLNNINNNNVGLKTQKQTQSYHDSSTSTSTTKLFMATEEKATLTDATTWQLKFVLRGLPTTKGRKVDPIFNIQVQFIEEDGYEPPQGKMEQIITVQQQNNKDTDTEEDDQPLLQIESSRWILSEDPNDRKDGLWVWGLFKEPLYPFMLLQFTTNAIKLPGEDGGDSIEPLQLFAQINHKIDPDKGTVLSRSNLKVRVMETVNADLFGVSQADIFEEKTVGQVVFQPIPTTSAAAKSIS